MKQTIGDCYVAVAGLPKPQPTHALILCRFACDCMQKMREILPILADDLGEGTAELNMRFGLHSGAVTAGVLRGAKSRFQLFGDTVNSASRMETNGQAGRIHVSEATAKELQRFGKQHWLMEREDRVEVKGKGEMTTFWVNPKSASKVSSDTRGLSEEDSVENSISDLELSKQAHKDLTKVYEKIKHVDISEDSFNSVDEMFP